MQSRPLPMDLRTIPARLGGSEQNAGQSVLVDPSRPKPDAFLVFWQSQSWIADHRACLYLTAVSCREVGDRSIGSGRFGIFGLILWKQVSKVFTKNQLLFSFRDFSADDFSQFCAE